LLPDPTLPLPPAKKGGGGGGGGVKYFLGCVFVGGLVGGGGGGEGENLVHVLEGMTRACGHETLMDKQIKNI